MTTIDTTAIATPADVAVGQVRINPFDGSRVVVRDTFMVWAGTLCTLRWKVYPVDQPDGPVSGWVDHEVLSTWALV